jgi:hypothetical protein
MNGKIIAQGVFENEFYKRVYYTDYVNVFRSLNIKDNNLQFRKESEFNNFQNGVLLAPIIEDVSAGGQIRSSTCFYTYRLITENGQVTGYSAFSKAVKILPEDTAINFAGGDVSESTDKKVLIKINIPDYAKFKEIECVVVEYEAKNAPTAIRSLGTKPCSIVTTFNHFGNEEEFTSNITISELTKRNNTWKYCSDVIAAKNKLITEKAIYKLIKDRALILRISNILGLKKKNLRRTHESFIDIYIKYLFSNKLILSTRALPPPCSLQ